MLGERDAKRAGSRPVSRKKPDWLLPLIIGLTGSENDSDLGSLLHEIYQAVLGARAAGRPRAAHRRAHVDRRKRSAGKV